MAEAPATDWLRVAQELAQNPLASVALPLGPPPAIAPPAAPANLFGRPCALTPAAYHAGRLRALTGAGNPLERAWHARWLWYALAPEDPASRPRVSVITPVYNRAEVLEEAIESVLAQDWVPHEVIVVDDGSSDHPEAALARFGERVQVHRLPENRGVGAARNAALSLATGELVQLLDSDSAMAPGAFSSKVAAFARIPDALLCFSGFEVLEGLDRVRNLHTRRPPEIGSASCATASPAGLVFHLPFVMSSVLMARHRLLASGGFDPRLRRHEDRLLFQRLGLAGTKCVAIDRPLLQLRIRADSLSLLSDSEGYAALVTFLVMNELLPAAQHWDLAALVLRQCFWQEQWKLLNRSPSSAVQAEMDRFFAWLDDFAAGRLLPELSPRPLAAEFSAMLATNKADGDEGRFATPFKQRLAAMRVARPPTAADLALWRQSRNPPINHAAFREIFEALSQDLQRGRSWVPLAELGRRSLRSVPHPRQRRWTLLARAARIVGDRGGRFLARWLG